MPGNSNYHYAIDAARLVEKCRSLLYSILNAIEQDSGGWTDFGRFGSTYSLASLSDALKCVDRLIHTHLLDLLDREMEFLSSIPEQKYQFFGVLGEHDEFPSLMKTVETLKLVEKAAKSAREAKAIRDARETGNGSISSNPLASTSLNKHRRASTSSAILTGHHTSLSIDDPVEDDDNFGDQWYYGGSSSTARVSSKIGGPASASNQFSKPAANQGAGSPLMEVDRRRSPSPPGLQSAGDSSSSNASTTNFSCAKRSSNIRHRRTFSTGAIDLNKNIRGGGSINYCPSRSAKDSSLFRLIVTLQLCLVRIEEANSVLCKGNAMAIVNASSISGRRGSVGIGSNNIDKGQELSLVGSSDSESSENIVSFKSPELMFAGNGLSKRDRSDSTLSEFSTNGMSYSMARSPKQNNRFGLIALAAIGIGASTAMFAGKDKSKNDRIDLVRFTKTTCQFTMGFMTASFIRKRWRTMCMNARVTNSAEALEDWIFHWICLVHGSQRGIGGSSGERDYYGGKQLFSARKSTFECWYSSGALRFQLMKRGMDLLYASIGSALEITRGNQSSDKMSEAEAKPSGLWMSVVAALAASYYNVVGPAGKSAQVISSSSSSVIQNAWGMVSLPVVKNASLEATRILKGASIADRMDLAGVSCFVLSREAFPALASALRRFQRQQKREDVRLGTIHEQLSVQPQTINVKGFQRRDVILHLTGGGFFAHTIAGDLPYLLDWSAASNAVVIIPEYGLLPQHKFPDAVDEITKIYKALRCGQAAAILGFQPDRIIVTGESAGGNLAAALCVTMIMEHHEGRMSPLTHNRCVELVSDRENVLTDDEEDEDESFGTILPAGEAVSESRYVGIDLPDALMICCPALNLSLDETPSRIDGANDPVLPSGLIAAISNSYLPIGGEYEKTHPVASPYFATDDILRKFPTTLIFTSSEDPFLDDSVNFNARLRSVGVRSRLRAVHDMPHAFWALATAGIPEARQVQNECQEWLKKIFRPRK